MTHVDDLYEPGDDREPCEPDPEPPLSLEEIEAAHALTFDKSSPEDPYPAIELLLERAVPQMLAELRAARERITEWEALEKREEWAVTARRDVAPSKSMPLIRRTAESAEQAVKVSGGVLWRRRLTVHPWEPIANEPPF